MGYMVPPPPLEQSEEELMVQMEVLTIEKKLEELRQLQLESHSARKTLLAQLRAAKGNVSEADHSDLSCTVAANTVNVVNGEPSMLGREFTISSQIGEPGQKHKLTHVSLINRIDSGLERGYLDKDICDAVIKAISPHSSLRNYILTLLLRSLKKFHSILRVFFESRQLLTFFNQWREQFKTRRRPRNSFYFVFWTRATECFRFERRACRSRVHHAVSREIFFERL